MCQYRRGCVVHVPMRERMCHISKHEAVLKAAMDIFDRTSSFSAIRMMESAILHLRYFTVFKVYDVFQYTVHVHIFFFIDTLKGTGSFWEGGSLVLCISVLALLY